MRVPAIAVEGTFLRRVNRFRAEVRIGRRNLAVHVAHSGRLRELLVPGHRVLVVPAAGAHRKTSHDLLLADRPDGRGWVCVDARVPNKLVQETLATGRLPGFEGYGRAEPEFRIPGGRLDFRFTAGGLPPCWVEVKCVTLVEDGVALFPDAPTARGARHLHLLMKHHASGGRAAILFVVLRSDAGRFSPNDKNDRVFGQALRKTAAAGVTIRALRCRVTRRETSILEEIEIQL